MKKGRKYAKKRMFPISAQIAHAKTLIFLVQFAIFLIYVHIDNSNNTWIFQIAIVRRFHAVRGYIRTSARQIARLYIVNTA